MNESKKEESLAHELSEKRLERLKDPYIAKEVQTIRVMTEIFCADHHGTAKGELCPSCKDFLAYATKRLASCPFGAEKPICKKCKIHCFQKEYKTLAKEIMAYAGPRMILPHPILAMRHVIAMFREAPEKPRAIKIVRNQSNNKQN